MITQFVKKNTQNTGNDKVDFVRRKKKDSQKAEQSTIKKEAGKLTCEHCGSSFDKKSQLQLHVNAVHLKLKPFKCEKCQKFFSLNQNLQRHIDGVHSQLKPFNCEKCHKCFSHYNNLKTHIDMVHLKLRPFQCHSVRSTSHILQL